MTIDELVKMLVPLDPAAFCDADKTIRVMQPNIARINPGKPLIGRARTVRCHDDFLTVIDALDRSSPGDVLVIDTQSSRRAVVGELFSVEAARRGLAGIIIDGGCRDTETLITLAMPVYAAHRTPVAGTVNKLFETDVEINCGGVGVKPNEIIFGDSDGVVVMSEEELIALLPNAQAIKATETRVLDEMRKGRSLIDMTNFHAHASAVRAGDVDSKLSFNLNN